MDYAVMALHSYCLRSLCHPVLAYYRADWEPAAPSGRCVLGVSWRCPAVLGGPSTPSPNQVSWKTLILKKSPIFPVSMWICGCFAPCGPSALLATKKASFGIKTCDLAIPLIKGPKLADFENFILFYFISLPK